MGQRATAEERLWRRIQKGAPDECWPWTGSTGAGYGQIRWNDGRVRRVHILAYLAMVGPIPPGLQLDHTCHTNDPTCQKGDECPHRRCCNPAHLEPVTAAENARRGRMFGYRKEVCKYGHPYTPENTYIAPKTGARACRTCRRRNDARSNRRESTR